MLNYNEIKTKKVIIYEGKPVEVMNYHIARKQQNKPQNQVKLKSLLSGKTWNTTFHVSDKAEEANISKKEIKFLFHKERGNEYWFCDIDNSKNRFMLPEEIIGDSTKFLKENEAVTAIIWEDEEKIINIKLPIKMEFIIKEAPPAIKGNTASGGNKVAILENGV
ncbi:MAG: hypothetical protein U9R00_00675, partial [Patescibacteria group bacterium]|nr:hypothetical protein [Patescibacteria group bacterium]